MKPAMTFLLGLPLLIALCFDVFGVILMVSNVRASTAFASDPVCTRPITTDTPARGPGPLCTIYRGVITRTYLGDTGRYRDPHIVIVTAHHQTFDIDLQGHDEFIYDTAADHKDVPAVLETIHDVPAYVVTQYDRSSLDADPHDGIIMATVMLGFGIGAPLVVLFIMRIMARPPGSPPWPLLMRKP